MPTTAQLSPLNGSLTRSADNVISLLNCDKNIKAPAFCEDGGFITTVVPNAAAGHCRHICCNLLLAFDFFQAIVRRFGTQLAFDNQQTVVFSNAVAA